MKTIALILLSLFSLNTFAQDYTQWGTNGGFDNAIRLGDAASGQLKAGLAGHADSSRSASFSSAGSTLAIASGSNDTNPVDLPIDISVPLGFDVEQWSRLEPIAMDFIANPEYGTGVMGATIVNAASDHGEVLLWRYSARGEELVARIPAKLVNAVPTVRFDQTGLFGNKLFVTINAGPAGQRKTRLVIVEPNGEFRDAISI